MILNPVQAKAVYGAMTSLSSIGARFDAFMEANFHVRDMPDGRIVVHQIPNMSTSEREVYADQAAFAAAYGLK